MLFKKSQISSLVCVVVLLLSRLSYAGLNQFDISESTVNIQELMSGGPSKDGIPSLDDPKFVLAQEAGFLRDDDKVIGIVIDGKAKAYPIRILNWHEIVNDQFSHQKVAVTWCPLTHSAIAFNREINGEILEFGVSGLLYNSNVVMYDRQSSGLWSQLNTSGLTGKFAKERLEVVPLQIVSWKNWHAKHPETFVLLHKTGHWRDYGRDPYADYHLSKEVMFPTGTLDKKLPPKDLVVGIKMNGVAKAYFLNKIARLNMLIEDQVGGIDIRIQLLKGGAVEVSDKDENTLPSVIAYWFAWKAFNGETLVY